MHPLDLQTEPSRNSVLLTMCVHHHLKYKGLLEECALRQTSKLTLKIPDPVTHFRVTSVFRNGTGVCRSAGLKAHSDCLNKVLNTTTYYNHINAAVRDFCLPLLEIWVTTKTPPRPSPIPYSTAPIPSSALLSHAQKRARLVCQVGKVTTNFLKLYTVNYREIHQAVIRSINIL